LLHECNNSFKFDGFLHIAKPSTAHATIAPSFSPEKAADMRVTTLSAVTFLPKLKYYQRR